MNPAARLLERAKPLLGQAVHQQCCSAAAMALVYQGEIAEIHYGRTSRTRQVRCGGQWRWEACPGTPIDAHTRFDLASLTKPMATSTLLALTVAKGLLRLEDRLDHWLVNARDKPVAGVTLGQLLSHAAGLPAWRDYFAETTHLEGPERAQAVRAMVLNTDLDREAGTAAVYSDLGFLLLGWVLEQALGTSLAQAFDHYIGHRLGLEAGFLPTWPALPPSPNRSHQEAFVRTEVWLPRCPGGLPLDAQVHDDNAAALQGVAGHAGLFASALDVGRWAEQWLRAAAGKANPLGLEAALAERWVTSAGAPATTWRHGWDTPSRPTSSAGVRVPEGAFGHLGFVGTSVWLAPVQQMAVVLLTNRVHPSRQPVQAIRQLRSAVHDTLWEGHGG